MKKTWWIIRVGGGYGEFAFRGTEAEAEEMRVHKARWEGAFASKRPAKSDADLELCKKEKS